MTVSSGLYLQLPGWSTPCDHVLVSAKRQIIFRCGTVPGGSVFTPGGRGKVFAAVIVKYFSRRVIRKGTKKSKTVQRTEVIQHPVSIGNQMRDVGWLGRGAGGQ